MMKRTRKPKMKRTKSPSGNGNGNGNVGIRPLHPPKSTEEVTKAGSAWVEGKVRRFKEFRVVKRRKPKSDQDQYYARVRIPTEMGKSQWKVIALDKIRTWPE